MKVNYVLMYGIPYVRYKEFETFEDISKFLINKSIVNYSIFKKLEDKEEVEMIYRDNDIRYLENEIERLNNIINELEKCVQNYIYAIEPRGCSINYNCEYDSEEDYINAMKEESKLNTFKFILKKLQELKGSNKE